MTLSNRLLGCLCVCTCSVCVVFFLCVRDICPLISLFFSLLCLGRKLFLFHAGLEKKRAEENRTHTQTQTNQNQKKRTDLSGHAQSPLFFFFFFFASSSFLPYNPAIHFHKKNNCIMRSKLKGFIYLLFFSWLGLLHTQHGETSVML